jgi:hypothetical protein
MLLIAGHQRRRHVRAVDGRADVGSRAVSVASRAMESTDLDARIEVATATSTAGSRRSTASWSERP